MMESHYESFVVRVWVAASGVVDHGAVVHSESGSLQNFRDLAEIPALIGDSIADQAEEAAEG